MYSYASVLRRINRFMMALARYATRVEVSGSG